MCGRPAAARADLPGITKPSPTASPARHHGHMAADQPHPARWSPLPLRRYREQIEMFRYDWNMGNRADFGDDYPEISWEQAERIWLELGYGTGSDRAAG